MALSSTLAKMAFHDQRSQFIYDDNKPTEQDLASRDQFLTYSRHWVVELTKVASCGHQGETAHLSVDGDWRGLASEALMLMPTYTSKPFLPD